MSNSTIALLVFICVIVFLLTVIIYTIAHDDKKKLQRSGSFASMVAFHDMQSNEKQNAVETVIEKQAQKKWESDESGKRKNQNKNQEEANQYK